MSGRNPTCSLRFHSFLVRTSPGGVSHLLGSIGAMRQLFPLYHRGGAALSHTLSCMLDRPPARPLCPLVLQQLSPGEKDPAHCAFRTPGRGCPVPEHPTREPGLQRPAQGWGRNRRGCVGQCPWTRTVSHPICPRESSFSGASRALVCMSGPCRSPDTGNWPGGLG